MENNEMEMNMKTEITDAELLSLLNSQTEEDLKKECTIAKGKFLQLKTFKTALKVLLGFTQGKKNFLDLVKNKSCIKCEVYTSKSEGNSIVHLDFLFGNDVDCSKASIAKLLHEELSHIFKTSRA